MSEAEMRAVISEANDLNAVHSVEAYVDSIDPYWAGRYVEALMRVCWPKTNQATWYLVHANASQRAEALQESIERFV